MHFMAQVAVLSGIKDSQENRPHYCLNQNTVKSRPPKGNVRFRIAIYHLDMVTRYHILLRVLKSDLTNIGKENCNNNYKQNVKCLIPWIGNKHKHKKDYSYLYRTIMIYKHIH